MPALRSPIYWALANAVGIAAFLWIASANFWIEPEVADVPGAGAGDAFGWIGYAAPIAFIFVAGNFVWLFARLRSASWRERVARACLTALLLGCWVGAYVIDHAHHALA